MPSFALVAQVNYSDGTKAEYRYDYNAAVDGWQYGAVSFNTASGDKSPVSVTARLEYSHEMGQANFGGVSLVSGTLNSYTYDANGFISGQNDGKSASSTVADEISPPPPMKTGRRHPMYMTAAAGLYPR